MSFSNKQVSIICSIQEHKNYDKNYNQTTSISNLKNKKDRSLSRNSNKGSKYAFKKDCGYS